MAAFTDEFRAYVRKPGARVHCAVTYDFPVTGTRHYSMVPLLYFRQNVIGFGSLNRTVDERSSQVQLVEFDVTHANTDRELEAILEGEDVRGTDATVRYVTPDLDPVHWPVRFRGRIERFEYGVGTVRVIMRTNDAVLRNTTIPRRVMIAEEFPEILPENADKPYPIVYGIHNSSGIMTGVDDKKGFLPGVRYIGAKDGPGWFIFALGALPEEGMVIHPVSSVTSELQYGAHNGVAATHVRYDSPVNDGEARLDASGYTKIMNAGFGSADHAMLNPVDQLRHLLNHFIYGDWRIALAADVPLTDATLDGAPIEKASWGRARDFASGISLEGTIYIGTAKRAQEVINDWLRSHPLFRIYWNTDGNLAICVIPSEWPGFPDDASHQIDLDWDDIGRTFNTRADTTGIAKRVSVSYQPNAAQGGTQGQLMVEDSHQIDDVTVQFDSTFSIARAVIQAPVTSIFGYPYQTSYAGSLSGKVVLNVYPTSSSCYFDSPALHGPGTHLGAGVWTFARDSSACHGSVDDPVESLDVARYSSVLLHATSRPSGRWLWQFGPTPRQVAIASVTLKATVRLSSSDGVGADIPFQVTGFVELDGVPYYAAAVGVSNLTYSRATTAPDVTQFAEVTLGAWAVNPATSAAWSAANFGPAFQAGIAVVGDGLPTSAGAVTTIDVGSVWIEARGAPTYTASEGVRSEASRNLRLFHAPVLSLSLTIPLHQADLEPGDFVYVSGHRLPAAGADPVTLAAWDKRPMFVKSVVESPGALTAQATCLDLRFAAPAFWCTFRSAGREGDQLAGAPYIDRGGGWSVSEKTVAVACHREPDFRMILPGNIRVTPWGVAVSGCLPDDVVWVGLNNTFSQGGSGAFSSWSITRTGSATVTDSYGDETYLVDAPGNIYRRSVQVVNGTGYAYLSQTITLDTSTEDFKIRFGLKWYGRGPVYSEAAPHTIHVSIRRGGEYWLPGVGWTAGADFVPCSNIGNGTFGLGSLAGVGDHVEWWSDEVNAGVGPQTISYHVGYCSQPGAVFWLLAAPIVRNSGVYVSAYRTLRHEFVPTTTAAISQQSDVVRIENDWSRPVWNPDRGTAIFTFVPVWDHVDLINASWKTLILALHDDSSPATPTYDAVRYLKSTSTDGQLRFERYIAGSLSATATFVLGAGQLAAYMTPLKIAVRWTKDGDLGLAENTMSIFLDGVKGTDVVMAPGALIIGTLSPAVYVGAAYPPVTSEAFYADGYIADVEFYPFCLRDEEIVRLQRGLTYPVPTVSAFTVPFNIVTSFSPSGDAGGTIAAGRAAGVGGTRDANPVTNLADRAGAVAGAIITPLPPFAHRAGGGGGSRNAVPHMAGRAGAVVALRSPGMSIVSAAGRARAAGGARTPPISPAGRAGGAGSARSAVPEGGSVVSGRAGACGATRTPVVTIT